MTSIKLITLKTEVSKSDLVISFFTVTSDDITQSSRRESIKKDSDDIQVKSISEPIRTEEYVCIHNYKALSKTELSIRKDTRCFVIEKNLSGWWFVDSTEGQGFVPQCIIKPINPTSEPPNVIEINEPEMHVVNKEYKKRKADEVTIKKGDFVHVLEKNLNGWWKVRKDFDNSIGMAPAVYLQAVSQTNINDSQKSSIPAFELFTVSQSTISDSQKSFTPSSEFSDEKTSNQWEQLDYSDHQNIYESVTSYSETSSINLASPDDLVEHEEDIYYVIESYQDLVGDGIDLFKGQKICVLCKDSSTGWWYVKLNDTNEGWAPSAFLSKYKPEAPVRPPPPELESYKHLLNDQSVVTHEKKVQNKNIEELYSIPPMKVTWNNVAAFTNEESNIIEEETYIPIKVSDMKKRFERN